MEPDAIFIPSGGTIEVEGVLRSTSYAERDASGTLGGYARVQAAAGLAARHPCAVFVPQGRRENAPSHAAVMVRELNELGVALERIAPEERSTNTGEQAKEALAYAQERGWRHIAFVTNEYHVPRLRAFVEQLPDAHVFTITYYSAESLIESADSAFAVEFARIKASPAYQERLASEARGLAALLAGTYQPRSDRAKQEHDAGG